MKLSNLTYIVKKTSHNIALKISDNCHEFEMVE